MDKKLKTIFKDFEFDRPSDVSVTEMNGVKLPDDYLGFVSENGGGEGAIGEEGYLQLWSLGELAEQNEFYEVRETLPNCVLIGTDLSGSMFGVTEHGEFFTVPDDMGLDAEEIEVLCSSFEEFMEKLGRGDYFNSV